MKEKKKIMAIYIDYLYSKSEQKSSWFINTRLHNEETPSNDHTDSQAGRIKIVGIHKIDIQPQGPERINHTHIWY